MPDREKVIKGLELCEIGYEERCVGTECPYYQSNDCTNELKNDILALLKEQKAKQAIKQTYHIMMNRDYKNPIKVTRYEWFCPTCNSLLGRDINIIDDNYHFCNVCGQAVKWDG